MDSSQTITINSKQVADSLDSQIIMLVKTLQIEQSASFEDALETARQYLNKKHFELMNDDDKSKLKKISNKIKNEFKNDPDNDDSRAIYQVFNYMGLYQNLT